MMYFAKNNKIKKIANTSFFIISFFANTNSKNTKFFI